MQPLFLTPNIDRVISDDTLRNIAVDVLQAGAKFPIAPNIFENLFKVVKSGQHVIIDDLIEQATIQYREMLHSPEFEKELAKVLARWMESKGFSEPGVSSVTINVKGQVAHDLPGSALLACAGDNMKGSI